MKAMGWERRPLGHCAKFLSGGTPSKSRSEFWEGEMTEARIHDTQLHITRDAAALGSRIVPANTVLVVVRGMSLAKEFRVSITKREMAFNQDLKAFACESDIEPEFLFYALLARREHIRELATEASHGTKKLETEVLVNFPILVPRPDVQWRVVEVISAYDDLIENNQRRMRLLEEAAQQLYREYFVRLRFPGYEHTRIIDSSLGPIAEGWRVVRLGDITTKIGSGATPRGGQSAYQEQGITLIRSLNVYDAGFEDDGLAFINDDQAAQLSHVTVEPRDILLNITGASVARCCMVPERHLPARVNQHVMIIRVDTTLAAPSFVLCAINSDQRKRQLLSYAQVGATREALTKETVTNFEIVLPDEKLLRQFGEFASNINHQREVLAHQNADLRAARDLLLPKLMSGEIAV